MEPAEFTAGWDSVHVGFEGSAFSIDGIDPWSHAENWRRVPPDAIVVPHPSYPHQRHRACVYEVAVRGKTVRFAAAELSNGVWGFYVPRHASA